MASRAFGVGHDEQASAWVWGAQCASVDLAGADPVASGSKVSQNIGKASQSQTGHVLDNDPCWPKVADDAGHGRPEPPRIGLRQFPTRLAARLTGETPSDKVNSGSLD